MMNIQDENARKAKALAEERAPGELWIEHSPRIYIAASRETKSDEQIKTLEKELDHARLIAADGHTVYLLPERGPRKVKHPDAVVDGMIMEFKTVTGNIRKVAENFKAAREKAENVFLKIMPGYSKEDVQRKLKRTIIGKGYQGGMVVVHFTAAGKTYYWNVDDLR